MRFCAILIAAFYGIMFFIRPCQACQSADECRVKAEQGDATAQFCLGVMYDEGRVIPQNYAEAMKWYRKAADQGNAHAQSNLGAMYYEGRGVPQNFSEAVRWYRKAIVVAALVYFIIPIDTIPDITPLKSGTREQGNV